MADADNKPTEEQVKAHNEAEEAKWQGDFEEDNLKIPYKRTTEEEKSATDDKTDDDEEKSTDEEQSTETYSDPAPVVAVQDPGEYQPADYSFEVMLKDGKTTKISTPEEAEKLADDPNNFETPKQLMDFINKQNKMNRNLERDYEKWQSEKKTFTEQLETETERRETIDTYVGEFQYLVSKGLIPAVDKQYLEADWSDPEIANKAGVKEQLELLNYMVKENEVRAKAGVKPIISIVDAYNAWQQDTGRQQDEAARKAAGAARKAAGARVAASSPAQQGSYVPKGIAVGNPNVLKRGAADWDN